MQPYFQPRPCWLCRYHKTTRITIHAQTRSITTLPPRPTKPRPTVLDRTASPRHSRKIHSDDQERTSDFKFPNPPSRASPPTSASTSTSPHHSLTTFLAHTRNQPKIKLSSTYQGTLYEYLVQRHLKGLSFELTRKGGRNDTGIDLLGHWDLYSHTHPSASASASASGPASASTSAPASGPGSSDENAERTRVLIQCKRTSRPTPTYIRELEGAFLGAPAEYVRDDARYQTLGVLVCTRPATKGIREAMGRSRRGLAWMMLEEGMPSSADLKEGLDVDGNGDGVEHVPGLKLRQFLWNRAAAEQCGLEGLTVALRYSENEDDRELDLFWQGSRIDFAETGRRLA